MCEPSLDLDQIAVRGIAVVTKEILNHLLVASLVCSRQEAALRDLAGPGVVDALRFNGKQGYCRLVRWCDMRAGATASARSDVGLIAALLEEVALVLVLRLIWATLINF